MYCDESEWFSWPWMRPSSLCREGRSTVGQSLASPGVHPPPSSWGSPGSPALRCAASSLPLQPCCLPPEGEQPSLPPYSEGKGVQKGRVKEVARSQWLAKIANLMTSHFKAGVTLDLPGIITMFNFIWY
uniref:Uncharacterized protein n=1 Tax=Mus spicilegus TaxID=10103 RepID=A0A8C6N5L8_MUSSI